MVRQMWGMRGTPFEWSNLCRRQGSLEGTWAASYACLFCPPIRNPRNHCVHRPSRSSAGRAGGWQEALKHVAEKLPIEKKLCGAAELDMQHIVDKVFELEYACIIELHGNIPPEDSRPYAKGRD